MRQRIDRLLAQNPLHEGEAASLVLPLAHALECTHLHGIIRRDLKPANEMLDRQARTPKVWVLLAGVVPNLTDLGLVKRLGPDQSQRWHSELQGGRAGTA